MTGDRRAKEVASSDGTGDEELRVAMERGRRAMGGGGGLGGVLWVAGGQELWAATGGQGADNHGQQRGTKEL